MQKQIFEEKFRLGNFVKMHFSFWVKQTRVVQPVWAVVQKVYKSEVQVFPIHHQAELLIVKKKDIFPIEITHDILYRSGFDQSLCFLDVLFMYDSNRNSFTAYILEEAGEKEMLGEVVYLHQFQNAYFQSQGKDFLFKIEIFDS